jgi:hypothetical protein
MTKLMIVEKLRAAVQEWAQKHSVELALLEVEPTGIETDVRVIVVARKGFENWPEIDRDESLYNHLRSVRDKEGIVNMLYLITLPEEEYDKYARVEV